MSFNNASIDRLDSDLLRTFLAVAAAGSVTAGAERVLRSQSAVSLQIKRLEVTLGQSVFERRGRGVALTGYGATLQPVAERVVALLDGLVADARAGGLHGNVLIGVPEEVGEDVMTAIVSHLARDLPKVELVVQCGLSAGFPAAVERGELDAAICDVETPTAGWPLLRTVDRQWITTPAHRQHERSPLPVALFDRACFWRDLAVDALAAAEIDHHVVYTSESIAGILAAVRSGLAVALVGEVPLDRRIMPCPALPAVSQSHLALTCRPGLRPDLAAAITRSIQAAFAQGGRP